ncbi:MAG TPA: hypothetical protein VF988_00195, partial [Verrucomicrobiae bacterium]
PINPEETSNTQHRTSNIQWNVGSMGGAQRRPTEESVQMPPDWFASKSGLALAYESFIVGAGDH